MSNGLYERNMKSHRISIMWMYRHTVNFIFFVIPFSILSCHTHIFLITRFSMYNIDLRNEKSCKNTFILFHKLTKDFFCYFPLISIIWIRREDEKSLVPFVTKLTRRKCKDEKKIWEKGFSIIFIFLLFEWILEMWHNIESGTERKLSRIYKYWIKSKGLWTKGAFY